MNYSLNHFQLRALIIWRIWYIKLKFNCAQHTKITFIHSWSRVEKEFRYENHWGMWCGNLIIVPNLWEKLFNWPTALFDNASRVFKEFVIDINLRNFFCNWSYSFCKICFCNLIFSRFFSANCRVCDFMMAHFFQYKASFLDFAKFAFKLAMFAVNVQKSLTSKLKKASMIVVYWFINIQFNICWH